VIAVARYSVGPMPLFLAVIFVVLLVSAFWSDRTRS
jgi:hypothetical protein